MKKQHSGEIFMRQFLLILSLILLTTGCNLKSKDATPIPTPDIPTVRFLFPSNNDQVIEGTDLTFDIYAEDMSVGVARVELFIDGQLLGEPMYYGDYQFTDEFRPQTNWLAQGIGRHTISAVAYRPDGTPSDEALITVEVIASQ